MNLYFVRHAQPDYEHDTITETGHQQAKKLAEWFKDIKVDELFHSSMRRAKITADYLAEACNITPVAVDWARELKWGKGNGDASDRMSPWEVRDRIISREHKYPQGDDWRKLPELQNDLLMEEYDAHCKNLDIFLSEHGYVRNGQLYKAENPDDKTVVIVCHGGVISALVSYLTNIPFFQYMSHLGVDLTSVTKVQLCGKKSELEPARLVYINSQAHLGIK